jgi:hypothetical protein
VETKPDNKPRFPDSAIALNIRIGSLEARIAPVALFPATLRDSPQDHLSVIFFLSKQQFTREGES